MTKAHGYPGAGIALTEPIKLETGRVDLVYTRADAEALCEIAIASYKKAVTDRLITFIRYVAACDPKIISGMPTAALSVLAERANAILKELDHE